MQVMHITQVVVDVLATVDRVALAVAKLVVLVVVEEVAAVQAAKKITPHYINIKLTAWSLKMQAVFYYSNN